MEVLVDKKLQIKSRNNKAFSFPVDGLQCDGTYLALRSLSFIFMFCSTWIISKLVFSECFVQILSTTYEDKCEDAFHWDMIELSGISYRICINGISFYYSWCYHTPCTRNCSNEHCVLLVSYLQKRWQEWVYQALADISYSSPTDLQYQFQVRAVFVPHSHISHNDCGQQTASLVNVTIKRQPSPRCSLISFQLYFLFEKLIVRYYHCALFWYLSTTKPLPANKYQELLYHQFSYGYVTHTLA